MPAPLIATALSVLLGTASASEFHQDFRTVFVAEGITAFVASESPGGVVQGNITLITGKDHSLLVDAGQYPDLARRIVAEIRASGAPMPKYLVNTHWHGDHLLANHVFIEAFPGMVLIQHAETARLGERNYARWAQQMGEFAKRPDQLEASAASGKRENGEAMTEAQRENARINAALIRQWLPGGRETRWSAPDLMVAGDFSLDLGDRTVAVRHLGNANTTGDIVVWDEATKTLVAGDIVVSPTPYSFGSYHSEWIGVLDAMRALQPARLVPGHGEVMADTAYLELLQALLEATREAVRDGIAAGKSLDDLRKEITLTDFERRFAGEDPARIRAFRSFYLAPGIEQSWKEAHGEPRSE